MSQIWVLDNEFSNGPIENKLVKENPSLIQTVD